MDGSGTESGGFFFTYLFIYLVVQGLGAFYLSKPTIGTFCFKSTEAKPLAGSISNANLFPIDMCFSKQNHRHQ